MDHACAVASFAAPTHLAPLKPGGFRLEFYAGGTDTPQHRIAAGSTLSYADPALARHQRGDLKVRIFPTASLSSSRQRLTLEWLINGIAMDACPVTPPGAAGFRGEIVRGTYKIILRLDREVAAEGTFRIE